MKKLSLYMISLMSAALVGCSDNYDPAVGPQTYLPESPVQMSDISVSNSASSIKIEDFIDAETDFCIGEAERMAHRDKISCVLGPHDPRCLCYREHIALLYFFSENSIHHITAH